MLDIFGMPTNTGSTDTQFFWGTTFATSPFVIWTKPRGKSFLSITCIGSGGGGGGAAGAAAAGAAGGGGGGGSSGVSHYLYNMFFIPDTLYLQVPSGGTGGAGGSSGNGGVGANGGLSYVSIYPNIAANNLLAVSGAVVAGAGTQGTTAAAGTGGVASTIATDAGAVFSRQALSRFYIAGVAGSNGGAQTGAVGVTIAVGTACMFMGGCGGAGKTAADFAGGGYSAVASTPYAAVAGGAAGSNVGSPGFRWGTHPLFYGGTGGGASNSTTGGAGGSGSNVPGVGGGGGGAGVTVGGRGGEGGSGLIIMTAF